MRPAALPAKTPARDRSPCAVRPCPRRARLHTRLRVAAGFRNSTTPGSSSAAPERLPLQLPADLRSAFSHLRHATPRSTRRPVLREHPSIELRDSTCSAGPSLIAARDAAGKCKFVLAAVALRIQRFDCDLARRSRSTDLHLERSIRGDNRFAAADAYRRSGFRSSANEI